MDLFYFTLKHGFRIVLHTICFLFIYFSMKFMYNVNRTFSDGRIAPAHSLLGYPNRQRQTVYTDNFNHGTQSRRGGRYSRVLDFHRLRNAEELLGVCLIYVNMEAIFSLQLKCSYDMS